MKKLLVLAFASILSSNTYSLEFGTNTLAFTLADTIYATALTGATTEASGRALTKKEKKALALRIQKEAQDFFQTGIPSIYLESNIKIAKELDTTLSEEESVDLLIEASNILMAE